MPDKHAHNKPAVSAELIRQYLAGELDDKAMHALERQALDDPFLAEALEGYALHAPDQLAHQEDLMDRLAQRVTPAQRTAVVRPLYPRMAAAAAILLLLFTGGWFLFKTQDNKAPEIAQASHAPEVSLPDTPVPAPADAPEVAMLKSGDTNNKKAAPARPEEAPALARTMEPAADISAKDEKLAEAPLERKALKQSPPNATFAAPVSPLPAPAAVPPALTQASPAITPVPAPASADKQQNEMAKSQHDSAAMAYYNDKALEEVTITGYGATRNRKAASVRNDSLSRNAVPQGTTVTGALQGRVAGVSTENESRNRKIRKRDMQSVPVNGWATYERYLLEHTANPGGFTGVVRVAFTVMPDSSLQDIKVVQSLNATCDAEAVRVVKEGPAWKPAADGKPANVTLEVIFREKKD